MQSNPWPIYVVSLIDAVKRRQAIMQSLARMSLKFQFIDAIDGRASLSSSFEGMIDRDGTRLKIGRSMSNAEYACALSHLSVYRLIVERKTGGAVILEDDALPSSQFKDFYQSKAYFEADLIQLDHLDGVYGKVNPLNILARATA